MAQQHADAGSVLGQVALRVQQREGGGRALAAAAVRCRACLQAQPGFVAWRLVQQQGDGRQLQQAGVLLHRHRLVRAHARAGQLHHLAVHAHKAAFDVLLSGAARAGQLFGHAFGQADVAGVRVLVGH